MRMRKPLDEALKWYNHNKQLKIANDNKNQTQSKVDSNNQALGPNSKIIEISVVEGKNLTISGQSSNNRRMLPFFSYDFYTFEVRSATAQGNNPNFEITKQF